MSFKTKTSFTEFDEAESYKDNDEVYSNPPSTTDLIKNYELFISKYKEGKDVETSLFRIIEIHIKENNIEKAKEYLSKLEKIENPKTNLVSEAEEKLKKLETESG